ncbi:MAG: hypothetical protein Kow0058_04770 [Roseovarius sp.]
MRKLLLSTGVAALAAAGGHGAAAQDWNMDWGGFMHMHVAVGDISTPGVAGAKFDGDGVDIFNDSEIHFTPSVKLDNGLSFGINVQLEGTTTGGGFIDESYASIWSDTFGRLDVGNENSAGYKMMVAAPGVTTMWINSPSTSAFIPFTGVDIATGTLTALPFRQAGISAFTEVAGNNDVGRITYYTPDFHGLTIGLSYANQGAVNAGNSFSINKNAVLSDIFDIGINYANTFGMVDLTLAARWGTGDTPTVPARAGASDPETWGVGFQVGFNNITVGGHYGENDNDETLAVAPTIADSEGWSFGVTYDAAGPWSFEALTYQSDSHIAAAGAPTGFKVEREAYRIGASRDLGPGVDWDIYAIYEDRNDTRTPVDDVEGTLLGTAINLSF